MAQSLNTSVEYKTKAVSYLGMGGKVGHILLVTRPLNFTTIKM
ncbi:putative cytoplasmic protein [Streptococcus pyogenes]|nr:putative cytoplasmic protein [Streptococcus pyogenes]